MSQQGHNIAARGMLVRTGMIVGEYFLWVAENGWC